MNLSSTLLLKKQRGPILLSALSALLLSIALGFTQTASAAKKFDLVEWTSPVPSIHELNLDYQVMSKMIGEGQLIITQAPRDFDLWTKGKIKSYQNARFSTVMIIINKPKKLVRELVLDTERYTEFMPQIRKSTVSKQSDKHFMSSLTQVYQMGPFPLKAKFDWQHTLEENGDISTLLHSGDIDAAAGRFEFLEISENKTLLVLTNWQDLSTAKLAFRILVKANPDFKSTIPAIAASLLLQQYKEKLDGKVTLADQVASTLPTKPNIPILTEDPAALETMIKLGKNGTLVFVQETQWFQDKGKAQDLIFASAVKVAPLPLSAVKPLALDVKNLAEFVKEIKKVEVEALDPNDSTKGEHVEAKIKVGLGFIGFSMDFNFDLIPSDENISLMLNGGGDMYPMYGAYEFYGFEEENQQYTLGVLTQGGGISEDAPYMVRLLDRKLPQFDFIRTIFSVLPQVEKQQTWIEQQLKQQAMLTAK